MERIDIINLLNTCIKSKSQVKIVRKKIDNNSMNGFPLIISANLVLIQYLYDFGFNGYKVIRIEDISSVRAGESEKFVDSILKKEGIIDKLCIPMELKLENWKSVFKDIKSLNMNIIIECEKIDSGDFYIGKIVNLRNESLSFLSFDPMGKWEKDSTEVDYDDITSITFNDRYINVISKYVEQTK